jgi:hypothetical protein
MLAVTVAAPRAAQAKEPPVTNVHPERATIVAAVPKFDPGTIRTDRDDRSPSREPEQSTSAPVQSGDVTSDQTTLVVGASRLAPEPEIWDGFRRSVAEAATSSCFDPHALSHQDHQELAVEGLLRVPFLVRAVADGTCR